MLAELRQLDPKPGRAFERGPVEVGGARRLRARGAGGGWSIELNSDILPRVLVNRVYYASVTEKARDAAEKTFLIDCLATANWLTKSLDQRAQTILKVATEIVQQQDGFLIHGIALLRPMTLKLVADAIEMHESTVSRVTSNKYIATPRGLFEMKYFFTTALGSSTGERRSLGRGGAPPHPAADRCRDAGRYPLRRHHRRDAAEGAGHRSRPPHRGQVPRGHEHPLLGHPPPAEARRPGERPLARGRMARRTPSRLAATPPLPRGGANIG